MSLTSGPADVVAGTDQKMSWYEEFFAALDAKDITALDRLCTPDTRVQFANHEPVEGRDAVREAMLHFWSTIGGMSHEFTNAFEVGDQTLLESDVTYTRLDGSSVVIKAGTVVRRRDGLVADQHIYVDLAPLIQGDPGAAPVERPEGSTT